MNKKFVKIGDKEFPVLQDGTLIGSWEDVPKSDNKKVSTITKDANDVDTLDGLIIRGYETKFGKTNENGERYEKDCLDAFVNEYFVGNGLNMPVDIQHDDRDVCGKVLYLEVNSTGFYFVVYVPREYPRFAWLKRMLEVGIIQGFSKFGWATDYEFKYKTNGDFDYELIKRMQIISMSLVATPANGIAFEKMQEVKNALHFVNKVIDEQQKDNAKSDPLDAMFN